MSQERYVAALEISSSKIIGTVGRTHPDGTLDIIAVEQEKCVECVRYGIIQNAEDVSYRIARILEKLEKKPAVAPRQISRVFVGLAGRSMRAIRTEVSLNLPDETEITADIIDRLRTQARSKAIDSSLEMVDAVPSSYFVGSAETQNPVGAIGSSIRGNFDLVVCRPVIKKNISRTLEDKLQLPVAGFIVTPLAVAHLVVTTEEKRLGCLLVDMGAETTTVTIFKHGGLQYFATIPLGSRHITRDITKLNLLEERAEEIKITSGNAKQSAVASSINLNGVKLSDISNLIVARAEEIVANIIEQIEYSGLKDSDLREIIAVGGGFKLNGMMDLLNEQSNIPVRRGVLPDYINIEDTKASSSEMVEVASVLYAAATLTDENCLETPGKQTLPANGEAPDPEPEVDPEKKKPKESRPNPAISRWKERVVKWFSANDDDEEDDF